MTDSGELLLLLRTWSPALPLGDRLAVLSALVAYWHGERGALPGFVETNIPLPAALRWLYSEVAARNPRAFERYAPGWIYGDPLVIFNSLRNPKEFEVDASGKLTFLIEQQGVYRCGTSAGSGDGPVFRQEMHSTDWRYCGDSLSDFLLWWIVFELRVCRPHTMWGLFPPATAARITDQLVPVNTGLVSTYGVSHRIWHEADLAVLSSPSGPKEICLEAVAREGRYLDALRRLAEWQEG
jgi:hypothetical protein